MFAGRRAACPAGRRRPLRCNRYISHSIPNSEFRIARAAWERAAEGVGPYGLNEMRAYRRGVEDAVPYGLRGTFLIQFRIPNSEFRIAGASGPYGITVRSCIIPDSELRIPNCRGVGPLRHNQSRKGSSNPSPKGTHQLFIIHYSLFPIALFPSRQVNRMTWRSRAICFKSSMAWS